MLKKVEQLRTTLTILVTRGTIYILGIFIFKHTYWLLLSIYNSTVGANIVLNIDHQGELEAYLRR